MKRKWIALVLSVSVLAGTAAVPAFASEIQQEISEMPSGSYACRDGFRGGELCSGWTER